MVQIRCTLANDVEDARRCWLDEGLLLDLFEEVGIAGLSWSADKNLSRMTEGDDDFRANLKSLILAIQEVPL